MTRNRAVENNVPNALMAEFYRQRASLGLLITEGTSRLAGTGMEVNNKTRQLALASSVRGTGECVIAADKGVFASVEVNTPELSSGLRMLGFVDAGWLANNNNAVAAANPARPGADRLASVGLGLRYAHSPSGLALSADYGQVVTGSVVPTTINSSAPKKGDAKLHVNLSVRF